MEMPVYLFGTFARGILRCTILSNYTTRLPKMSDKLYGLIHKSFMYDN